LVKSGGDLLGPPTLGFGAPAQRARGGKEKNQRHGCGGAGRKKKNATHRRFGFWRLFCFFPFFFWGRFFFITNDYFGFFYFGGTKKKHVWGCFPRGGCAYTAGAGGAIECYSNGGSGFGLIVGFNHRGKWAGLEIRRLLLGGPRSSRGWGGDFVCRGGGAGNTPGLFISAGGGDANPAIGQPKVFYSVSRAVQSLGLAAGERLDPPPHHNARMCAFAQSVADPPKARASYKRRVVPLAVENREKKQNSFPCSAAVRNRRPYVNCCEIVAHTWTGMDRGPGGGPGRADFFRQKPAKKLTLPNKAG